LYNIFANSKHTFKYPRNLNVVHTIRRKTRISYCRLQSHTINIMIIHRSWKSRKFCGIYFGGFGHKVGHKFLPQTISSLKVSNWF